MKNKIVISTIIIGLLLSVFIFLSSFKSEPEVLVPQSDYSFIGEVRMFSGTFAPRGWALCDGQMLLITNNQALFSILGTTYGGDGRTTFTLPDLKSRVALHPGDGYGLTPVKLGQKGRISNSEKGTIGFTSINYIICIQGSFPSRN